MKPTLPQVLRNRDFRNLWLAHLLSVLGTQISRIGLLLYLFQDRSSILALAGLVVLETLPGAFAAPFAGAVIDRFSKRGVMIASDVIRAVTLALLLLWPTLGMIYLMAALHSVVAAFFKPAKNAALPLVVAKEDLPRANAADQGAANLVLVLGPVVGAHLLLTLGLAAVVVVDLVTYLASAVLVVRVRLRPVVRDREDFSLAAATAEIRDGWHYLTRHPTAFYLNFLVFNAMVCTSAWMPLAPFIIRDRLGAPDSVLGWQMGLLGWGTILGALAATRLVNRFGRGPVLFAGFVLEAACLCAYATIPHVGVSTAITFVWGIAVSVIVVPFYSILQAAVDDRYLGRIFTVVHLAENCAVFVAMGMVVVLYQSVGSQVILLGTGLIYLASTLATAGTRSGRTLLATT